MKTLKRVSLVVMAFLYGAAGVNHFLNPDFYLNIMPPYLPTPLALVYLSGVAEVLLGVLLLPRRSVRYAAWGIIAMLVVFLLVHVHMVIHPRDFPGVPLWALWLRLPLQGVLILWAWTALLSAFVLYPVFTGSGASYIPIGAAMLGLVLYTVLHPQIRRRRA